MVNIADDNTLRVIGKTLEINIQTLREEGSAAFNWFLNNHMKANPDKFQLRHIGINLKESIVIDTNIKNNRSWY